MMLERSECLGGSGAGHRTLLKGGFDFRLEQVPDDKGVYGNPEYAPDNGKSIEMGQRTEYIPATGKHR